MGPQILLGKYVAARVNEVPPEEEENVSPGIRQTLLQWAFQVETDHLDLYKEEKGIVSSTSEQFDGK